METEQIHKIRPISEKTPFPIGGTLVVRSGVWIPPAQTYEGVEEVLLTRTLWSRANDIMLQKAGVSCPQ